MKLKDLLKDDIRKECLNRDREIDNVCRDSRKANAKSLFVCVRGFKTDGRLYARDAYKNGCRAFIAERDVDLGGATDCDVIKTDDARRDLAYYSDIVYGKPSEKIKVIGITGTKGKTTTALMIYGILNELGISAGYIGTTGVKYGEKQIKTENTTPESCDLQAYLKDMADRGIKYVVAEVSSQALKTGRVNGVRFEYCVFTNLSKDHIGKNEHKNYREYRRCKARLFRNFSPSYALVNADDKNSAYMLKGCRAETETFGLSKKADHRVRKVATEKFDEFTFEYVKEKSYPVRILLPGTFNALNAAAAIAVCRRIADVPEEIIRVLGQIKIKGRFEHIEAVPNADIFIDYAHNGASLKAVLKTLRSYRPHRIIALFGSVGDRTKMRRKDLGKIALKYSDFAIITSDNPGDEDPCGIMNDIAEPFKGKNDKYVCIADRKEAIEYGVRMLREGDILLLAGKGHEDFQLIKGKKIPFNEREIINEAVKKFRR